MIIQNYKNSFISENSEYLINYGLCKTHISIYSKLLAVMKRTGFYSNLLFNLIE